MIENSTGRKKFWTAFPMTASRRGSILVSPSFDVYAGVSRSRSPDSDMVSEKRRGYWNTHQLRHISPKGKGTEGKGVTSRATSRADQFGWEICGVEALLEVSILCTTGKKKRAPIIVLSCGMPIFYIKLNLMWFGPALFVCEVSLPPCKRT